MPVVANNCSTLLQTALAKEWDGATRACFRGIADQLNSICCGDATNCADGRPHACEPSCALVSARVASNLRRPCRPVSTALVLALHGMCCSAQVWLPFAYSCGDYISANFPNLMSLCTTGVRVGSPMAYTGWQDVTNQQNVNIHVTAGGGR